jgi:hypothetical protein
VNPLRTIQNVLYNVLVDDAGQVGAVRTPLADGHESAAVAASELRADAHATVQNNSGRFVAAHFEPVKAVFEGNGKSGDLGESAKSFGLTSQESVGLPVRVPRPVAPVAAA